MKKIILAAAIAACPLFAQAIDVNVDLGSGKVQVPGANVSFGSRDSRGYYWDGHEYRDPDYWKKHDGNRGEKYYTGRGKKGDEHCPPGQAKKGNC